MVPNTEAEAGKHESSASKLMIAIDRFDILIPRRNHCRVPRFFLAKNSKPASSLSKKSAKEFATQPDHWPCFWNKLETETMRKQAESQISYYFSALGCALDQGRTAISVGRKAGNRKDNRNKLCFATAHCRWGKTWIRGNRCSAAQMSGSAAIHGTFGVIGDRGEMRLRFWCGRIMVVMLVHRAITVVHCHRVAGNGLACSSARCRHDRRKHG